MSKADSLEEVKKVLMAFSAGLAVREDAWQKLLKNNPDFPQLSKTHWKAILDQCWTFGTTEIEELNALEHWRPTYPDPSDTAKSSALHLVTHWKEWLKITDAYYEPFQAFEFQQPDEGETLLAFLIRMAYLIETEGPGARLEWRAFKSFLGYLRNLPVEEVGFIDHIFPRNMEFCQNKILRKITPEQPSLPQGLVGTILCELAATIMNEHKNSQFGAAEALGLCWICLAASRLKLPLYFEKVHQTAASSLTIKKGLPFLSISTLLGPVETRISKTVHQFLGALSRIPSKRARSTILQTSSRSLKRPFEIALKRANAPESFGNITFVSLLEEPHPFGEHRFQLQKITP